MSIAVIALLLCASPAKSSGERPKLIVLEAAVAGGIDPQVAGPFTEALTTEIASRGFFDVVSSRDVQTLLGVERQRQLLGCSEQGSCMTELAGALGARFVVSSSLAKLGDTFQLTLQGFDSVKSQPLGRSVRLAKDLSSLRAQLPWAVAEATGTPAPPAPSHLLSYASVAGGAALIIGAGVVGFQGYSEEAALDKELSLGGNQPAVLKPDAYYQDAASRIRLEKSLALVGVIAGAGLVGLGIFLNPREGGGASTVALTVTPNGFGIAGVFP